MLNIHISRAGYKTNKNIDINTKSKDNKIGYRTNATAAQTNLHDREKQGERGLF